MPLSEHEQRILQELEESLVRQDPQFADKVRNETVYRHAGRRCKWAALGFVIGIVVLLVGFTHSLFFGLLGVSIMFACAIVFERNFRKMSKAGWNDITRSFQQDEPSGALGIENAIHDAREWFRSRFNRNEP